VPETAQAARGELHCGVAELSAALEHELQLGDEHLHLTADVALTPRALPPCVAQLCTGASADGGDTEIAQQRARVAQLAQRVFQQTLIGRSHVSVRRLRREGAAVVEAIASGDIAHGVAVETAAVEQSGF
jgi:hypothetical protein